MIRRFAILSESKSEVYSDSLREVVKIAKFKQLNRDLNNVLISLISNQQLCKLLKYNSNNPLEQPDIKDTSELIQLETGHVFPIPKIPSTNTEKKSYLTITHDSFRLASNSAIKEWLLKFDLIIHNDLWVIDGMLRPFSILHEIDEMFNGQRIVGIKKAVLDSCVFVRYGEQFSGYQVRYQVASVN